MLTMRPAPASVMPGSTACAASMATAMFSSRIADVAASVISPSGCI